RRAEGMAPERREEAVMVGAAPAGEGANHVVELHGRRGGRDRDDSCHRGEATGEDHSPASNPVTANHLSSLPARMKTIGATQGCGSAMVVSMSEFPDSVAANPPVVTFLVTTLSPSSLTQLTSARNCASSFFPRSSAGTSGSSVKTRPWTRTFK